MDDGSTTTFDCSKNNTTEDERLGTTDRSNDATINYKNFNEGDKARIAAKNAQGNAGAVGDALKEGDMGAAWDKAGDLFGGGIKDVGSIFGQDDLNILLLI